MAKYNFGSGFLSGFDLGPAMRRLGETQDTMRQRKIDLADEAQQGVQNAALAGAMPDEYRPLTMSWLGAGGAPGSLPGMISQLRAINAPPEIPEQKSPWGNTDFGRFMATKFPAGLTDATPEAVLEARMEWSEAGRREEKEREGKDQDFENRKLILDRADRKFDRWLQVVKGSDTVVSDDLMNSKMQYFREEAARELGLEPPAGQPPSFRSDRGAPDIKSMLEGLSDDQIPELISALKARLAE